VSFNLYKLPEDMSCGYGCTSYEFPMQQGFINMYRVFKKQLTQGEIETVKHLEEMNIPVPIDAEPEIYFQECQPIGEKDDNILL
jgi:hypothetical protein